MDDAIRVTAGQAVVENFRRIETRTGRPMVSFRVAVGKEKLSCVAFNATAETTELRVGDQVFVAGRLQSTSWTTAEGDKRWGVQVVADRVELIDEAQPGAQGTGEAHTPAPAPAPPPRPAPSARQRPAQRRLANQGEASEFDFVEGPF